MPSARGLATVRLRSACGISSTNARVREVPHFRPHRRCSPRDFSGANLKGARLVRAILTDSILCRTVLEKAYLFGTYFASCDLKGANLQGGDLTRATFDQGDASGANFRAAKMANAIFRGVHLENADFSEAVAMNTTWANTDLRRVQHLDDVEFFGPSTIGNDTVKASVGQIPDIFLRGCGIPDEIIAYVRSLRESVTPIQLVVSHASASPG